MLPNKLRMPVRFFLAAAVGGAILAPSMSARAQEPSLDSSDGAGRPVAAGVAVVPPRITSMRHTWTGDAHEEFRLDIRFSQDVTGFTISDIEVFGADPDPPPEPRGQL